MSNISLLDCTLRDGGYINNWKFGRANIRSILSRLTKAGIDIVETGFLEDGLYDPDSSLFTDVEQIKELLPENRGNTQFVAMTRYGHMDINNLREYDGTSINGIRVTFHENEAEEAIEFCKKVNEKGYKTYVQPVGTTSYTDEYLLRLIRTVNELRPFAFYIVDTLGLMRKNDLLRMYFLVDNNLDPDIIIGFHSHNNLQLSFSNAQELVDLHTKRRIILDSSVYGMGRGAGNLNTELIAQHLNFTRDYAYNTDYLLEIIDETIDTLSKKYTWGYSVPYYLAAINNCHPNYATYLMNRKTLPVKSIGEILKSIRPDQRELYNEQYVAELYLRFQKHHIDDRQSVDGLRRELNGKKVLVIAPGKSINTQRESIDAYLKQHENVTIISINFDGDWINPDYCFFSNNKRFQRFIESQRELSSKIIITSNVEIEDQSKLASYVVNYSDYLNRQPLVNDNAALMLIALLIRLEIPEIAIAGFDGFHYGKPNNYAGDDLENTLDKDVVNEMNRQISEVVREYGKTIRLNFITSSLYQ
mgnify:CR=1 FL=1